MTASTAKNCLRYQAIPERPHASAELATSRSAGGLQTNCKRQSAELFWIQSKSKHPSCLRPCQLMTQSGCSEVMDCNAPNEHVRVALQP
jgi:hypothetical protein